MHTEPIIQSDDNHLAFPLIVLLFQKIKLTAFFFTLVMASFWIIDKIVSQRWNHLHISLRLLWGYLGSGVQEREEATMRLPCCRCCAVLSCSAMSNSVQAIDCSPPDSSVHGYSPARIPEWVAILSSSLNHIISKLIYNYYNLLKDYWLISNLEYWTHIIG